MKESEKPREPREKAERQVMPYSVRPRLDRFEVFQISREDWFNEYERADVKYHDARGIFGAPRYDYFVYANNLQKKRNGGSRIYLMLHNRKSLENMRNRKPGLFEDVRNRMKQEYSIDVEETIEDEMVIMAVDSVDVSSVCDQSMNIIFGGRE